MPLTVEDGSGRSDADAYVSVADCDEYCASMGRKEWIVIDPGDPGDEENLLARERAIRQGTAYLDARYAGRWRGNKRTAAQALSWPRVGAYDPDGYLISGLDKWVVSAACEAAYRYFTGADMMPDVDRGGQVISESVGSISVTYASGAPAGTTFSVIDALLYPCIHGKTVWAVRA